VHFSLFEGWPLKKFDLWPFFSFSFYFKEQYTIWLQSRLNDHIHSKQNSLKVRRYLQTPNGKTFHFCIFRHVILLLIYECVFCLNVYEPNESLVPIETRRENQRESLELKHGCELHVGAGNQPGSSETVKVLWTIEYFLTIFLFTLIYIYINILILFSHLHSLLLSLSHSLWNFSLSWHVPFLLSSISIKNKTQA